MCEIQHIYGGRMMMNCLRCGGMSWSEVVEDPFNGDGCVMNRCISCGDLTDAQVWAHRVQAGRLSLPTSMSKRRPSCPKQSRTAPNVVPQAVTVLGPALPAWPPDGSAFGRPELGA